MYLCNEFGLYSLRPDMHMKLRTEKIIRIMWNWNGFALSTKIFQDCLSVCGVCVRSVKDYLFSLLNFEYDTHLHK